MKPYAIASEQKIGAIRYIEVIIQFETNCKK